MEPLQIEGRIEKRPHSTLFARLASHYLQNGRHQLARELCERGLKVYPTYSTAHLILARCFAADGNFVGALRSLQIPIAAHPESPVLTRLYRDWTGRLSEEEMASLNAEPVESGGEASAEGIERAESMESDSGDREPVTELVPDNKHEIPSVVPGPELESEDDEEVAVEPSATDLFAEIVDDGRLVSATLAEIYAKQGAYAEAITSYRILSKRKPAEREAFERRIAELRIKLQGGNKKALDELKGAAQN